jgi:putative flippase GtrA
MASLTSIIDAHRSKFLRYAGVSCVTVPIGQFLLFLFNTGFGWPAAAANLLAVSLASIPAYLLNRRWVWGKRGPHSFVNEVLPFWIMALAGLLLSTLAVAVVASRWDNALAIAAANLLAFGVLWIIRYVIMDQWLFRVIHHNDEHRDEESAVAGSAP